MFLRCEVGGLESWCDGLRYQGSLPLYLSLFGPRNAVRAAWARLSSRQTPLKVGTLQLYLGKEQEVETVSSTIRKGITHLVMVDRRATAKRAPFATEAIALSQGAFFGTLNSMCPIPMRPGWESALWEAGLGVQMKRSESEIWEEEPYAQPPIRAIDGFGEVGGWAVNGESSAWLPIVQRLLQEGKIT